MRKSVSPAPLWAVLMCCCFMSSWMTDPDRKLCFSPLLSPSLPVCSPPLLFTPSRRLFGDPGAETGHVLRQGI